MAFGKKTKTTPRGCGRCRCTHQGGLCLSCNCACRPSNPAVCPCCGADDRKLGGRR
ncbi:hypothetical protein GCM10022223_46870 [Kineosporia mesophila]|uniref:Metallothionein n=1 Tax=Kineosporia mesophila TaxID=566012 RepID=A0ABP7A3Y1_9ACTN